MMIYEIDPSISTPEALRADPNLAKAADDEYTATQSGPRTAVGYSAAYLPFSHYTSPSEICALVSKLPAATSPHTAPQRDQILMQCLSSPDQRAGQVEFLFDVSNYSPPFPLPARQTLWHYDANAAVSLLPWLSPHPGHFILYRAAHHLG
jgi:hypothetical protein